MIACFLSNISAKYYKNPSMLSRVIAKIVGDVFFETQCRSADWANSIAVRKLSVCLCLTCVTLSVYAYKLVQTVHLYSAPHPFFFRVFALHPLATPVVLRKHTATHNKMQ